jgi:hypothetical protein
MLVGSMKDIPVEEISLAGPASRRSTELKGIKFLVQKDVIIGKLGCAVDSLGLGTYEVYKCSAVISR